MKKKEVKNKTIHIYEAIFFGGCILLFVFMLFKMWW